MLNCRRDIPVVAAVAVAVAGLPATQAVAQVADAAPMHIADDATDPFGARAQSLIALLANGTGISEGFSADFLAAVPIEQVQSIIATLRNQNGAPLRVARIMPSTNASSGTVVIAYERAEVTMEMAVDGDGRIAGLRIVNVVTFGDSIARLNADFAALPGTSSWGIYRIAGDGTLTRLHGANTAAHLAIGSSFKLAILGALDAEITAGRLQWADVIRLNHRSVPSSAILGWPDDAPMTLHSLATLMISISDNRATDMLLYHIGRERIEAFARSNGGLSGSNAFPMLSTLEATVLKNPALGAARRTWLSGNEAQRRTILASSAPGWTTADVDYGAFSAGPADINQIEWFASSESLARLLGWYAQRASPEARAILAINPGVPTAAAQPWAYLGYKGGSEPGVMAVNYLLRTRTGEQFAITIAWNDPARAVDEPRLATLATRAVALILPRE